MAETSSGKVLFLVESGGPGGAERVVLSLAEEFHRRGIPFLVATLRRGWFTEQLDRRGFRHIQLPVSQGKIDMVLLSALHRIIRDEQITVIHSHLFDSNFYGSIAAARARVRHVATEHGDVHHITPKSHAKLKMFLADRAGTRFTAVSAFTADALARQKVRRRKIQVIGNPIALPKLDYRAERRAVRARLGVTEERDQHWVWVHVANFRPVKDQATLLRGFAQAIRLARVKQTLVLVGDGPEKEKLFSLVADLGIQMYVKWVGFSDEVGVYLAASDGFVLSSKSEAMPMSLLEAALYELVLVSSKVGGVPEIVQDKRTGYLFPAGNFEALANVMTQVVSTQNESVECGRRARELVVANFLMDRVVEKFLTLYDWQMPASA